MARLTKSRSSISDAVCDYSVPWWILPDDLCHRDNRRGPRSPMNESDRSMGTMPPHTRALRRLQIARCDFSAHGSRARRTSILLPPSCGGLHARPPTRKRISIPRDKRGRSPGHGNSILPRPGDRGWRSRSWFFRTRHRIRCRGLNPPPTFSLPPRCRPHAYRN